MDMDDPETGVQKIADHSLYLSPEKADDQKIVGPNVGASLDQQDKQGDDSGTPVEDESGIKTASEKEVPYDDTAENFPSKEDRQSKAETDPEGDPSAAKNKEDVVDVEDIDSDDVPMGQRYGESVTKRLRSNIGEVVSYVTRIPKKIVPNVSETLSAMESPKTMTKTTSVGPKKGWRKAKIKTTVGRSRKRKGVSSSESEYNVEEDVTNIISSTSKKSTGRR